MEGVKLTLDGVTKLNITYQLQEESELSLGEMVDEAEETLAKGGIDEQLASLFKQRGNKLVLRASKKTRLTKEGL